MSAKDTTTLYTALLAAQRAMGPVKKDASNPAFRSKYASLQSILDTIEQPLWDNGLVLVQRFEPSVDRDPVLITEIIHAASGERITSALDVVGKDRTDPQKVGSAITYARRYSLLALLGLTPEEDDDGNAAAKPAPRPQERPRREPLNAAPLGSAYDEAEYERLSRQVRVNDEALSGAEYSRYNELDRLRKERPAPAPPAAPVANRPHADAPANWTTIWREAKAMGIPGRAELAEYVKPEKLDDMQEWQILARLREARPLSFAG
jgi:hypothetical protein